jgi:transcriptional regulator with XRE-family HTH domain
MQSFERQRRAAKAGAGKVVRKVRKRLAISQEALSRLLSTTKGAVQHWERGRNNPDFARLLALRSFCPAGPERRGLDRLLERVQVQVSPAGLSKPESLARLILDPRRGAPVESPEQSAHRRDHQRLERQLERLNQRVSEGAERMKALENLVDELRRMFEPSNSVAPRGLGWTTKEPD